jgi:hypothetical protein
MKMKVVINTCFGGFSLSDEAWEKMLAYSYTGTDRHAIPRNNPILVDVVEELGEKANGSCSKLKIVELTFKYIIEEYEGKEEVMGIGYP